MSTDPREFAQRLVAAAKAEAERILEEARRKAEEIVAAAKAEAERIRRRKEAEIRARIRAEVSRLIGMEKRKARLEVSLKRRELVDEAIRKASEEAAKRLNKDIVSGRLDEALRLGIKRKKLVGPERLREKAESLGLEFEPAEIRGFRLISDRASFEDTVESRVERRYKRLEAVAAEEILGRRVRL